MTTTLPEQRMRNPLGIARIAHVCIFVRDIERTIRFYRDCLGMPLTFRFMRKGRLGGAYFQVGDSTFLEAFEKPQAQALPPGTVTTGLMHLCLEVADIDHAIAALGRAGVACSEKKLGGDQTWQTWLRDPDGNAIELHQYTAASCQALGGEVEITWD